MSFTVGPGFTIGAGFVIGAASGGGGGGGGVDNVTGYAEMNPPVTPNGQVEDITATINSPIGFTINNDLQTGIAIPALSPSNQAWFASYGTGLKTVTWGPGSTVASSTINLTVNSGPLLIFFVQGQVGPATYNYPFTFS